MSKIIIIVFLVVTIFSSDSYAVNLKKRYIVKFKRKNLSGLSLLKKKFVNDNFVKSNIKHSVGEVLGSSTVESIEEDIILNISSSPNDPYFYSQWSLNFSSGGIEMPYAWEETTGSSDIVIAVVDTGILAHQDLDQKVLNGYDFISDASMASDGDGRDSNAKDEGDYVTFNDSCSNGSSSNSSWHGTHVAGIIAAKSNNSMGISGVTWNSKILPVRVLGKCGGYTSDIADGIRWAAGVSVSGIPINPNPAKIINLSLGGQGACSAYMQDSINQARSKGSVIVVAAGNSSANLDFGNYTPANCSGVIVVGSNNKFGDRSSFSNYGKSIDVSAPGGGSGGGVLSLGNSGTTTSASDSYVYYEGTSMAAPHVSGVAALILAVSPDLFPDQVEAVLESSSDAFSSSESCQDDECGAGIINAHRALEYALTMTPDSSYSEIDAGVNNGNNEDLVLNANQKGGLCGSIDIQGGGNGPGNGPLSFLGFSLIFLVFIKSKKLIV